MKLYSSMGPHPRVVRMFAAEKGIPLQLEELDIVAGENREMPYLAVNPLGATPALELPSGQIVTETLAICDYLEDVSLQPALIGDTPQERAVTRMWAQRISLEFVRPLVLGFCAGEGRAIFSRRVPVVRQEAAVDLIDMAFQRLDWLEETCQAAPFLLGDRLSLADILLFAFVDCAPMVGTEPLAGREKLSRWFDRIAARPSVKA